MNKSEAKALMTKYLLPTIEKYGYKERKMKSSDFSFVKKRPMGEDEIIGGFMDYNPIQRIIYSFSKRQKPVIDVLLHLQDKGVNLSPPIGKPTGTIGFSYNTINNINSMVYLPDMRTENDVEQCVSKMTNFMEETAFPLLDKFEDIREIDRVLNGEEPWIFDWQKPYVLGGNFQLKRLIFAKLAGQGNYDRIFEFVRREFISHFDGPDGEGYKMQMGQIEELNKLLVDVKPLY
jgi:hypothetical protein